MVCSSNFETLLFRAAFALAFYGALRVGELVSSKVAHGGIVSCDGVSVRLFIRCSKTDQAGRKAYAELLWIPGSIICPVAVVVDYIRLRPAVVGVFLVHLDGAALSTFQFVLVLWRCLSAACIEALFFLTIYSYRGYH